METTDKKIADAHDKMLDKAEGIFESIKTAIEGKEIGCEIPEEQIEEVSIHLAKNAETYLKLLKPARKK